MKHWNYLCFMLVLLVACTTVDKKEQEILKTDVNTTFALFHTSFFTANRNELPKLKENYPYMFPAQMADSLVIQRMNDTIQQAMYKEVKQVYGDFETQKEEINTLFKHIKYYHKDFVEPTVVTDITGLSYGDRVLYANNLLLISLDMYLGKEHEFYGGFPLYLTETFTPKHLTTEIAKKIIETKYRGVRDRTFLGQIIFEGKKLYMQDLFLPKVSDEVKLGYMSKKMEWTKNNEAAVWSYFIKNEMLYSNSPKLKKRFIDIAPFSKFYKGIDKKSPGGIGKYIGLQIVRAYMEEHKVSIEELMKIDGQTILAQSGFKPKKN